MPSQARRLPQRGVLPFSRCNSAGQGGEGGVSLQKRVMLADARQSFVAHKMGNRKNHPRVCASPGEDGRRGCFGQDACAA